MPNGIYSELAGHGHGSERASPASGTVTAASELAGYGHGGQLAGHGHGGSRL